MPEICWDQHELSTARRVQDTANQRGESGVAQDGFCDTLCWITPRNDACGMIYPLRELSEFGKFAHQLADHWWVQATVAGVHDDLYITLGGTMRQMFPKKADLLKNNEFLRFLKIHSGCPKLFQQWWNLMIGWRQCLPLNILRIPKRPIYFPYDLGFNMGSVWERGSHFLGVPAIFLCFELFSWIMELITTAATLDPDLDQWQFMCLWLVVLVRMYTVFVVLWRVWRLHKKYKFKLSICLGFRVNHSGFQAEPDPQAHLSSLISMYPNLQRCYHHSSNRYSHLWMAQEPHSAFNHHLNHNSAIPMHDCLTHYISGQIIATSHGSLTPYFRKT